MVHKFNEGFDFNKTGSTSQSIRFHVEYDILFGFLPKYQITAKLPNDLHELLSNAALHLSDYIYMECET